MLASLSRATSPAWAPGVPYAIAAKFAHPDRPVFALVGDGAMQMNGLAELITIAKYRERWSDQRLCILVLHNNDLNQVTWEQRAMEGNPKFEASQDLPDFHYARLRRADRAARASASTRPRTSAGAWDAGARRRPAGGARRALRPDVPPLPPHITLEQAKAFASAVAGGDPNAVDMAVQSVKQKLDEFVPRSSY